MTRTAQIWPDGVPPAARLRFWPVRGIGAFLAVSGCFVAANVAAAAVMWLAGHAVLVFPGAHEEWWPWLLVGILGVAAGIATMARLTGRASL